MGHILVQTSGRVGKKMAGPAIRSWEFAKTLSKRKANQDKVYLLYEGSTDVQGEGFELLSKKAARDDKIFAKSDCLITQNLSIEVALKCKKWGVRIIIDAYDPLPLEILELFKKDSRDNRKSQLTLSIDQLIFNFQMCDMILCASEKQRDLWIGFLTAQNLLPIDRYDEDSSLRHFIDVVPFGMPSSKAEKRGPGIREQFELSEKDKIIVWGGGIWNWFDPLTLIEAMHLMRDKREDIKLVFMGVKLSDNHVPEMKMAADALKLATDLQLLNRSVFFNNEWVPYEERQNYLLDAAIGASTHFDHLETRFSFRTRILDYLWTSLPILATEGDSFAEVIEKEGLGKIVPYKDSRAIAEAIFALIDDKEERKRIQEAIQKVKGNLEWQKVVKPIEEAIKRFRENPRIEKGIKVRDLFLCLHFLWVKVRQKGIKKAFCVLFKRLKNSSSSQTP